MHGELKGIVVTHALPGRVRLKIPRVKHNPELARKAQENLSRVPGVQKVEANPATGSLLILYDLAMAASMEALGPLGEIFGELFPEVAGDELAAGLQDLMETGDAVDTAGGLLGAANPSRSGTLNLKLLLPLTLLFLGGRKLFTSGKVPFPAWYDLLWFGFASFVMLNRGWVEGAPEPAPAPKRKPPQRARDSG